MTRPGHLFELFEYFIRVVPRQSETEVCGSARACMQTCEFAAKRLRASKMSHRAVATPSARTGPGARKKAPRLLPPSGTPWSGRLRLRTPAARAEPRAASLSDLPSEILQLILSALSFESLVTVQRTCALLKTEARAPAIWMPWLVDFFDGELPSSLRDESDPHGALRRQCDAAQSLKHHECELRRFVLGHNLSSLILSPALRSESDAWRAAVEERRKAALEADDAARREAGLPSRNEGLPRYRAFRGGYYGNRTVRVYGEYVRTTIAFRSCLPERLADDRFVYFEPHGLLTETREEAYGSGAFDYDFWNESPTPTVRTLAVPTDLLLNPTPPMTTGGQICADYRLMSEWIDVKLSQHAADMMHTSFADEVIARINSLQRHGGYRKDSDEETLHSTPKESAHGYDHLEGEAPRESATLPKLRAGLYGGCFTVNFIAPSMGIGPFLGFTSAFDAEHATTCGDLSNW